MLLFVLILLTLSSFGQSDTIVLTNNRQHVGAVTHSTRKAVFMDEISNGDTSEFVIGKHLVAYISYSNGGREEFKMRKWNLQINQNALLRNRQQWLFGGGFARYSEPSWGEEDPTGYLRWFYKTRIRFCYQSQWYFTKNEKGLSLFFGMDWLDASTTIGTWSFWGGFRDWYLTTGMLQPSIGSTILVRPQIALDMRIGGGLLQSWERNDPAYTIKADAFLRSAIGGIGLFFAYDQTRPYGPANDSMRTWFAGVAATLTMSGKSR